MCGVWLRLRRAKALCPCVSGHAYNPKSVSDHRLELHSRNRIPCDAKPLFNQVCFLFASFSYNDASLRYPLTVCSWQTGAMWNVSAFLLGFLALPMTGCTTATGDAMTMQVDLLVDILRDCLGFQISSGLHALPFVGVTVIGNPR